MIVLLVLSIGLLGVCLGLNFGADIIRRQVMDGKVTIDGRSYFCYPDSLTSKDWAPIRAEKLVALSREDHAKLHRMPYEKQRKKTNRKRIK